MKETFISHSSADNELVFSLIDLFDFDKIWVDHRELQPGDRLIESIEKGIDNTKYFLVLLSKNSIESKWVKYEISMAIYRALDDKGFRLIVAKIDDVNVPTRLKPFISISCDGLDEDQKATYIYNKLAEIDNNEDGKRTTHHFVNRTKEIGILTDCLNDNSIHYVFLYGFRGIGKQSLTKKAIERNYSDVEIIEIELTTAHIGAVLALELCSKAKIELPKDGTTAEQLQIYQRAALERMLSKKAVVIFKNFEAVLEENGTPNDEFTSILKYFDDDSSLDLMKDNTLFFISNRKVDCSFLSYKNYQQVRIGALEDKHMLTILKAEVEHSSDKKINESDYNQIVPYLHGYPLAGRIAGSMISHYGNVDFITGSLAILQKLQVDIAKEIMSKIELDEVSSTLLEVLSMSEVPFPTEGLSSSLGLTEDICINAIDNLSGYNLIDISSKGIQVHPIVTEYYQKRICAEISRRKEIINRMADYAKKELSIRDSHDFDYVYWLTTACRLLTLSNRYSEAKQLRSDFIGIIKDSIFTLFDKEEYELALNYCDEYLNSYPSDNSVLYIKARCLSRLHKFDSSKRILVSLIHNTQSSYLLSKYNFGLARLYDENRENDPQSIDLAINYYNKSISYNKHPGAIQSLGELYHKLKRDDEALSIIEMRVNSSPADPYALSIYADILWSLNRKSEAIAKIEEALKHRPRNTSFLFRAGTFAKDLGDNNQAYYFLSEAVKCNHIFVDARLSLAAVCLDLKKVAEAKRHLQWLNKNVPKEKKEVLSTIEIQLAFYQGDVSKVEMCADRIISNSNDSISLQVVAKVYRDLALNEKQNNRTATAELFKQKALQSISLALSHDPRNLSIIEMKNRIDSI